jgi:hypothetical protein
MKLEIPPNTNKKIQEDHKSINPTHQKINIKKWLKASVLGLGLMVASPSFAQNSEEGLDNNKNQIELMEEMSFFYKELSKKSERSLSYLDYEDMSNEKILELENEIKKNISFYGEIANNPVIYYKKILEKSKEIKEALILHFSSADFLNKLKEYLNEEEAKNKQRKIIDNLNTVKLVIASPDSINKQVGHHGADACYSEREHRILIPFSIIDEHTILHEFIHSAYRADQELTKYEKRVLNRSFKIDVNFSNRENEYQREIPERIVRKKILDLEMEEKGIKKYNEKFTQDHYNKLKELKNKGEVSPGVQDILNTSSEKQLIQLMNNIAYQDAVDTSSSRYYFS